MRHALGNIFWKGWTFWIMRATLALALILFPLMTIGCDGGDSNMTGTYWTYWTDPGTPKPIVFPHFPEVLANEREITFGIIADTHIDASFAGYPSTRDTSNVVRNRDVIDNINDHCSIDKFSCLGVVHLGDMIDAHSVQNLISYRQHWERNYPGKEAGAVWKWDWQDRDTAYSKDWRVWTPVFPGIGNHGIRHSDDNWNYALDYIKDRIHDADGIVSTYMKDAYAWRWGRYLLIQLGLWAGSCQHEDISCTDTDKLNWLRHLLSTEVGESGDGVLIFQHYGWEPFSTDGNWWTPGQREAEINVLCRRNAKSETCNPYNVLGIFSGHNHDRAWPIIDAGMNDQNEKVQFNNYVLRDSGAEQAGFGFSIVQIDGDTLYIRTKNVSAGVWYTYHKIINVP